METAQNRVNIVILDACRDNPFGRSFRTESKGLASIDAPSGTIIAYATAPGKVAADGEGANSPYTAALVQSMREPGLKIEDVFKRVRATVQEATRRQQTPWESSSLVGDLMPKVAAVTPVPTPRIEIREEVRRELQVGGQTEMPALHGGRLRRGGNLQARTRLIARSAEEIHQQGRPVSPRAHRRPCLSRPEYRSSGPDRARGAWYDPLAPDYGGVARGS
jgi:hypothetical protein